MKQYITPEQLNELNEKEWDKLRKLIGGKCFFEKVTDYTEGKVTFTKPLLSIGQMIEFLGEYQYQNALFVSDHSLIGASELCDALWEAVKDVLEK